MLRCTAESTHRPEAPTTLRLLIELVYDPGCPNVEKARAVLARALQELDIPAVWSERDTQDPGCPDNRKGYGSPTILVNGEDVAPGPHQWSPRERPAGPRCRLYRDGHLTLGAPPLGRVLDAIHSALAPDVV